jgi:hypothetical protein
MGLSIAAFRVRYVTAGVFAAALFCLTGNAAASEQADFDGDGKADLSVFRPDSGNWYVLQSSTGNTTYTTTQWGLPGDVPLTGDFDGDGTPDFAVYRRTVPWNYPGQISEWYILLSSTGYASASHVYFGVVADVPVPGDYDGDGKTDIAVYRPADGTWHVLRSSVSGSAAYVIYSPVAPTAYTSDFPVPADYDGDGATDLAVYRRTSGAWYFRLSSSNFASVTSASWGAGIDRPVPADYDGDGKADLAVYTPSLGAWLIEPSSGAPAISRSWGLPGDVTVPADYDGDGMDDLSVYRPANGVWYILTSSSGYTAFVTQQWGLPGDQPIPYRLIANGVFRVNGFNTLVRGSDFDGDGRSDISVFRPSDGTWNTLQSGTGYQTSVAQSWGLSGDVPVPADFNGDGLTEPVVWRPNGANWYFLVPPEISYRFSVENPKQFGLAGDIPISIDIEGNGVANLMLFRPGGRNGFAWFFIYDGSFRMFCGTRTCTTEAGDVPVPADYDGDGRADLALYAPATGTWALSLSSTRSEIQLALGIPGDIAVPGDYDGDGAADVAVFRPSTGAWIARLSSTGYATIQTYTLGVSGDIPVPGDFDGDGVTDVAVYHPATGVWSILKSSTNFTETVSYQWGLAGDVPILGRQ